MRAKTRIGQKLPLSGHTSVFSLVSSVQLKIPPKINIVPLDFLRSLNHYTRADSPESEEADKYRYSIDNCAESPIVESNVSYSSKTAEQGDDLSTR